MIISQDKKTMIPLSSIQSINFEKYEFDYMRDTNINGTQMPYFYIENSGKIVVERGMPQIVRLVISTTCDHSYCIGYFRKNTPLGELNEVEFMSDRLKRFVQAVRGTSCYHYEPLYTGEYPYACEINVKTKNKTIAVQARNEEDFITKIENCISFYCKTGMIMKHPRNIAREIIKEQADYNRAWRGFIGV